MIPVHTPTVSVIIPCYNERDHIADCVRSLLIQEAPPGGFEVLVVDGDSTDGTRHILEQLAAEDPRVRILQNPKRLTACAMNVGVRNARGAWIAILGAHNRYAPDYLLRSWEAAQRTGADNVGGTMLCEGHTWVQQAIATAHHSFFSTGGARWHRPNYEGPADTVFGGFYKAEVFARIGLFDEELVRNQDDELNLRLTRSGGRIWQSAAIKSWYNPRSSLRALFNQYTQYGYWKVRVIQKHRLPASVRHLVPGGFVGILFAGALLTPIQDMFFWLWFLLLGSYLSANLGASAATALRSDWRLMPLLPIVFACYHFGYGYGFLCGLLDFLVLRRAGRPSFSSITRPVQVLAAVPAHAPGAHR